MLVVAAYAFAASFVLATLIDRLIGFRISAEDEVSGVDFSQHAETAYAEGVHGHGAPPRSGLFGSSGATAPRPSSSEDAAG
ncbi:Ammonia channel [Mycolicibacterium chubuense]|uniref:Ammonia channel n=1 Tax=Mycolicibacterium chubuense TaxID=1800 RepID=A0A0J6VT06_MYCCU|nr:Ammonia channel [Mycolicibacterium chubuense]